MHTNFYYIKNIFKLLLWIGIILVPQLSYVYASKVPDKIIQSKIQDDNSYLINISKSQTEIINKYKDLNPKVIKETATDAWIKIKPKSQTDVINLESDKSIKSLLKDKKRKLDTTPNDPCYTTYVSPCSSISSSTPDGQWNLKQIHLSAQGTPSPNNSGWDLTTGSSNTIVAILDTGVDFDVNTGTGHPDLQANVWQNTAEINGVTGIDDDKNGKVDDKYGWNFADNNNNIMDLSGHGTHVAGIIAASGNNGIGVTGICWSCKIMPVKIFKHQLNTSTGLYEDYAYDSDIASGIYYATDNGAKVINMSIGGPGYSQVLQDAVNYAWANGVLVVSASGNSGASASDSYPGGLANNLSVGATNYLDSVDSYSNFGPRVDIVAPGTNVLSTKLRSLSGNCLGNVDYYCLSGTSMASPHVAGVAALLFDKHRSDSIPWGAKEVKYALLKFAYDGLSPPTPQFDNSKGWGRLNAYNSLSSSVMPADSTNPVAVLNSNSTTLKGNWDIQGTVTDNDLYIYTISFARNSDNVILAQVSGRSNITNNTLYTFNTSLLPNDVYKITIFAQDFAGNTTNSNTITVTFDNSSPSAFTLNSPGNNNYVNTTKPTFAWNQSYSTSAVTYDLYINNSVVATNINTLSYTLNNMDLSQGSNSWYVIAKNGSGITTQSNTQTFQIDSIPPNDFALNISTYNNSVTISFNTTDNLSGIAYYDLIYNNNDFGSRTSPFIATGQLDGNYTVTVRAYDNAGNYKDSNGYFTIDTRTPYLKSKGDLNGDGKVDLSDLSILAHNFNTNSSQGDINGDGKVDLTDLSILAQDWYKNF